MDMDEVIMNLEERIQFLVKQCEQLQYTNSKLKQNQAELTRERDSLLTKQKIAISQIESMVSRLKSIENLQ